MGVAFPAHSGDGPRVKESQVGRLEIGAKSKTKPGRQVGDMHDGDVVSGWESLEQIKGQVSRLTATPGWPGGILTTSYKDRILHSKRSVKSGRENRQRVMGQRHHGASRREKKKNKCPPGVSKPLKNN